MLNDSFKKLYKNVPIVVWANHGGAVNVDVHNHAEIELSLRSRGEREVTINNKSFITRVGDILIKNPFDIHSARSIDDNEAGYCMCFDCSLIADETLVEALKNGSIRVINHIDTKCEHYAEIKKLFMNIIKCYDKNSKYIYLELKAHISLLFAFLLNNGYICEEHPITKDEEFYRRVLRYISENYQYNITSKDVADALSYNHSYFCRKFRKIFERRFYDYLNMYRVVEAQKFFSAGGKTVAQIGLECGFNTQTYFSECFKKYTGMLPSEFKRKVNSERKTSQ